MKIVVGSASQRKQKTAEKIIRQLLTNEPLEFSSYEAKSGVPETPYERETFIGAKNRAQNSKDNRPDADLYIGMESGLVERYGHIYEEAWAVLITKDDKQYFGYSSGLKVPDYIIKKMDELKLPHGEVMAILEEEFKKTPNDTWGIYSGEIILREVSLEESLRNALIQIIAPKSSFYNK